MKEKDLNMLIFGFLLLGAYFYTKQTILLKIASGFIALSLVIILYPLVSQRKRFGKATLEKIDVMSGTEFEEYVGFLLEQYGFGKVKVTQQQGDQGIDVIAHKNNISYGFQCKRWKKNVGNKAIQEVHAGIGYYGLDKAIVITNSDFTSSAQDLAKKLDVELWNRKKLESLIETYRKKKEEEKIQREKQ